MMENIPWTVSFHQSLSVKQIMGEFLKLAMAILPTFSQYYISKAANDNNNS